ncbi:MAG TPA: amidohydrolase family protein [Opitutaceae bacterium]|nr:amidohydrolase family protein [Opitutaceae bacterium]
MIIDIHAHYPRGNGEFPRLLVERMRVAGIDKICLFSAGELFGHADNAEVLRAAQEFPEHIVPFALIELGIDSPDRVDEYAARGFRGFKITNPRSAYDNEAYFPVYERMERTGLPLLAHTGILMIFRQPPGYRVNSAWMRPICLDPVLRSFPQLNIIGAHLGAPWHDEASMMARVHANFYVDLTGAWWGGWRVNKSPEFYRQQFFWERAWDKVLFGTDILALEELLPAKEYHDRLIESLKLPPQTVANIYGGTAARLLRL